jgi:hypothetical protein
MKTQNLIASVAAILFTTVTLSALTYNVDSRQAPKTEINGRKVIDLAPINVHPSAGEQRAAALLTDVSVAGIAMIPSTSHLDGTGNAGQFSLIGSQLAMPYYSFGNKFGRISKE